MKSHLRNQWIQNCGPQTDRSIVSAYDRLRVCGKLHTMSRLLHGSASSRSSDPVLALPGSPCVDCQDANTTKHMFRFAILGMAVPNSRTEIWKIGAFALRRRAEQATTEARATNETTDRAFAGKSPGSAGPVHAGLAQPSPAKLTIDHSCNKSNTPYRRGHPDRHPRHQLGKEQSLSSTEIAIDAFMATGGELSLGANPLSGTNAITGLSFASGGRVKRHRRFRQRDSRSYRIALPTASARSCCRVSQRPTAERHCSTRILRRSADPISSRLDFQVIQESGAAPGSR